MDAPFPAPPSPNPVSVPVSVPVPVPYESLHSCRAPSLQLENLQVSGTRSPLFCVDCPLLHRTTISITQEPKADWHLWECHRRAQEGLRYCHQPHLSSTRRHPLSNYHPSHLISLVTLARLLPSHTRSFLLQPTRLEFGSLQLYTTYQLSVCLLTSQAPTMSST